jgi:hypothetical protein
MRRREGRVAIRALAELGYVVRIDGLAVAWPPVKSFLREYNLKGKIVVPFNTNAGYGAGSSFQTVRELCPQSTVLEGSTLIATCQKMAATMEKHGIKHLYPGHFDGRNFETKQRLDDEVTISKDVLSGKMKGEPNPRGMLGLNLVVTAFGVRINYGEKSLQ